MEGLVHLASRIEQHWRVVAPRADKSGNLHGVFVGDREDHQPLRLEMRVDHIQVGHLQAAGSAPRGPEVDHDNLAAKFRQGDLVILQVLEGEIGFFDVRFEVRELARSMDLAVAAKGDSQEICFVPNGDYAAFLDAYLKESRSEEHTSEL